MSQIVHTLIDSDTGEVLATKPGPFLRTPFNYDTDEASFQSGLACLEAGKTMQQFKEECDINTIVERFGITGELPENVRMPLSGDFTEAVTDYQTALNLVRAADEAFMELPAKVRERFSNDPQRLQTFLEDDNNREEARSLGLVVPEPVAPPPPPPIDVRVVPEPSPKA